MLFILIPAIVVLADQLFKYWVTTKLVEGGTIVLIKGIIHLTYVENRGAAFSILEGMQWLLIVLASIGILAIIYIMLTHKGKPLGKIALAMVLGGAIGNLIDRVVLGYVVDMFSFDFMSFAIFNIADIFITVGGVMFLVDYIIPLFGGSKRKEAPANRAPVKREPVRIEPDQTDYNQMWTSPVINIPQEPVRKPEPVKEKPLEASSFEDVPKYSETAILEEYDLERLLAEYRSEYDND